MALGNKHPIDVAGELRGNSDPNDTFDYEAAAHHDDEAAALEAKLAEGAACATGGCSGPQCASSVLAVRYAKIVRQERLLAMAADALKAQTEFLTERVLAGHTAERERKAITERAAAIVRQIDAERKEQA